MRWIVSILTLIAITAQAQVIDPALKPYYQSFLNEAKQRGCSLNTKRIIGVKFPNRAEWELLKFNKYAPYGEWLGVAVADENKNIIVFFNPVSWYSSDSTGRELTSFHEFTHAFLSQHHNANSPLMSELASDSLCKQYLINRKQILDNLFKR